MFGVVVNAVAIAIGAIIGVLFRKILSEKITSAVMMAMGIATFLIGLKGALSAEKTLLLIFSIAMGTAIGTIIDIDKYINKLGEALKKVFVRNDSGDSQFAEGFASASVLFAVGAMAVLGSISAGLNHDYSILFVKATLDFVASIMYAATLGIGVAFSSITVFLFQGIIAFFAGNLKFLADNAGMMNEFSAVGNILVMVIGLNLMGVIKVKVANMLPAIVLVVLFYSIIP